MIKQVLTLLAITFCTTLFAQKPLSGFDEASAAQQFSREQKFDSQLSTKNIDQYIKDMSAHPHHVASPGDKAVIDYIYNKFKSWGYETQTETFYVLFPTPKTRVLEMISPTGYKALLKEPALKEDGTSGQTAEQLPIFNCYSADG